jgi:hypothetical protein
LAPAGSFLFPPIGRNLNLQSVQDFPAYGETGGGRTGTEGIGRSATLHSASTGDRRRSVHCGKWRWSGGTITKASTANGSQRLSFSCACQHDFPNALTSGRPASPCAGKEPKPGHPVPQRRHSRYSVCEIEGRSPWSSVNRNQRLRPSRNEGARPRPHNEGVLKNLDTQAPI